MNTPSSKPIRRYVPPKPSRRTTEGGAYLMGLPEGDFASVVGQVITFWPHLEEAMIGVLGTLIGSGTSTDAAHPIFRSINAERLRVDIMQTLLETSPINKHRSSDYDDALKEFLALNKLRNDYVHGLWFVNKATGKVAIAAPDASNPYPFYAKKPVSLGQVKDTLKRIRSLWRQVQFGLLLAEYNALYASHEKHPQPASEGG